MCDCSNRYGLSPSEPSSNMFLSMILFTNIPVCNLNMPVCNVNMPVCNVNIPVCKLKLSFLFKYYMKQSLKFPVIITQITSARKTCNNSNNQCQNNRSRRDFSGIGPKERSLLPIHKYFEVVCHHGTES